MLEVRLTIQENAMIERHAFKLKLKFKIKADTNIAINCPAIASQRKFKSVLGFIQLSLK